MDTSKYAFSRRGPSKSVSIRAPMHSCHSMCGRTPTVFESRSCDFVLICIGQARMPNARVLYVSATGATEVDRYL